jgi:hypothetical protein
LKRKTDEEIATQSAKRIPSSFLNALIHSQISNCSALLDEWLTNINKLSCMDLLSEFEEYELPDIPEGLKTQRVFVYPAQLRQIAMLPSIALNPDDDTLPFPMQRLQFPIKLAYCMTINKAQGQSLSRVGIHLVDDVFGHGQLYVAVSRAISRSRLKLFIGDGVADDGRPVKVRNVVYQQALKFNL